METKLNINSIPDEAYMTPILYADLVALRDAGQLKPGIFYRITDYVTTTTQENTQSAGHQFDIIVLALSESKLSEQAYAAIHEGDTYFTENGANLSAWKIWYCLDNDSTRFAWADAENGKGVIYRLIDEWNNDCPYDFKNIMFVRYELASPETVEGEPWLEQMSADIQAQFTSGQLAYIWGGVKNGDRYWEANYEALLSTPTGNTKAFFTFSNVLNNEVLDKSLKPSCHDNSIGKWLVEVEKLSNNVFFATNENSNCHSNNLGKDCYSNSFDEYCDTNSLTTSNDKVAPYVKKITFGKGCSSVFLQNDETASSRQQIQNIRVANGASGIIVVQRNLPARDWVVGEDESGTLTIKALI